MTDKTLILHIGSPKTGTTAIQGYLKGNVDALRSVGVNFVTAGRQNISHNGMIGAFKKGQGADVCTAIAQEIKASDLPVHIVSSEMFFRAGIAQQLSAHLPDDLIRQTRVVCYLRRQDKYIEALYKQLVKNGRIPPDAMQFHARRLDSLAYSQTVDAFGEHFGQNNIALRPFERRHFTNSDVVDDFFEQAGVIIPDRASEPETTNQTFSAPVSEMLGMLKRNTKINTRELIRVMTRQGDAGAVRSGDVYDFPTRCNIVKHHADDNERLRATYTPTLDQLFDLSDLDHDDGLYPSPEEQTMSWRLGATAVARGLGDVGLSGTVR
jgi:hypothetical protein